MTAEEFIDLYQQALATHRWISVEPLIHEDASVTFSTGAVHKGKEAVRFAFERNFSTIEGEEYKTSNVHWVMRDSHVAVYLFDFHWTGRIGGRDAAGSGRGTSVLIRNGDGWQLLAEHLGPAAR
jgi:ketosteroid isomerase-like protein